MISAELRSHEIRKREREKKKKSLKAFFESRAIEELRRGKIFPCFVHFLLKNSQITFGRGESRFYQKVTLMFVDKCYAFRRIWHFICLSSIISIRLVLSFIAFFIFSILNMYTFYLPFL